MKEGRTALDTITDVVFSYTRVQKKPKASHTAPDDSEFSFYEFFAGGGMARAGLGQNWRFLFGNDFDFKKAATYAENWGSAGFLTEDVAKVEVGQLPGNPALVWASFPCQDLSLAGMGAGLKGDRSGTFWSFWKLVKKLRAEKRGPRLIVLENVCGTLTSHGGKDFTAISDALAGEGYRFGAVVIDAAEFVPQSRPRLFIIAVAEGVKIPAGVLGVDASLLWHPKALQVAHLRLTGKAKTQWLWWKLPAPPRRNTRFADLVEENPSTVSWHSTAETSKLLNMMSDGNLQKVKAAQKTGQVLVGTVYKRTRFDEDDDKVQRAEIRFDDIAGCLRTASGGSSRQLIVVIKGNQVRSRLISSREAARLMGLPDDYKLPKTYNEAYHLTGDGVVVPVVRYLAENLLEPILANNHMKAAVPHATQGLQGGQGLPRHRRQGERGLPRAKGGREMRAPTLAEYPKCAACETPQVGMMVTFTEIEGDPVLCVGCFYKGLACAVGLRQIFAALGIDAVQKPKEPQA